MKTPRYTDQHKYPNGYKRAGHTDVAATFRRIRLEQSKADAAAKALADAAAAEQAERERIAAEEAARNEAEAQAKTVPMRARK